MGLEILDAQSDAIALIMLGAYMPECDGFEFLARKRQDPRFDGVPVIMMTASSGVENFRVMNDRYGTAQCDRFLRSVADTLTEKLPGFVFGGRIGADVFAFLIEHRDDDWTNALSSGSESPHYGRFVVKFGIYADVDHTLAAAAICDRATLALGKIKKKFGTNIAWYDDEMRDLQLREHQIEQMMESALAQRQFVVYYQPKHNLHTDATGGAEALVRWISPDMGFVSPGQFIPLFERNGFITNLDFYIWEEVCRELRRCIDAHLPVLPISVNVSRMDFEVSDLAERIAAMVDKYGLDHSLLHIELTESMYTDNPQQIEHTLAALHQNGFFIELDDFGAGYSSLTSLSTLTLDVMKIDMSLIRHAARTNDYSILRFATLLADGMRLKTVVEGVETEDQVAALKVLGCDYIQGYFFSKPLPAEEYEAYLTTHCAQEVKA